MKKLKGQSRMDNPETLAIWDTQDTVRRQTKQKHNTNFILTKRRTNFVAI